MIPFTQYVSPDGQPCQVMVSRPPQIEAKAAAIVEAGFRFEVELLSIGQMSLTIHDPVDGANLAIELCANETDVPGAIDALVTGFHKYLAAKMN